MRWETNRGFSAAGGKKDRIYTFKRTHWLFCEQQILYKQEKKEREH